MSEIITDDNGTAFIEQKCCIEFNGQKFCSGGSWLCVNAKTGKLEGFLYSTSNEKEVTSWDGSLRIPATYGKEYRNNFGALCQSIWFKYQDHYFYGRLLGKEWSQIVRCKEITKKSYYR